MGRLLTLLALLLPAFHCVSQTAPLVKQWDYSYGGFDGDFINQLLPAADGGFAAAGNSVSNASLEKSADNWDPSTFPTYDCWLIKCDAEGNKLWDRTLGGSNDDFYFKLVNTLDSGYLLLAYTRSPQSGDISTPPIGNFDAWVVRLDKDGNTVWEKRYGGTDHSALSSALPLGDGGFLLGGYTDSPVGADVSEPSYGTYDFWIMRVDSDGNKLWDRRYGGSAEETIDNVFRTGDGGFLLGGLSLSDASGLKSQDVYVNGQSDMWFVKIDSSGNFQWDKQIGSLDNEIGLDMFQTTDHHYVIATSTTANAGADKSEPSYGVSDFWMIKTDSAMNVVWDHDIGGSSNEDDFGNIFETAEGNYMIAGTSYSDINYWKSQLNNGPENTWVVLVDTAGNKVWDKTIMTGYTHTEAGYATQLLEGCYVFANDGDGMTQDEKTDMSYSFDYWCIKFCDTTLQQPTTSFPSFAATDTSICEKFCINYQDSSANNPTAWQWFFPGGTPSSATDQNPGPICYFIAGSYDVTLVTTNADGNDTLTLPGYITVFPTPDIPTITQVDYTLTSSPAFSYQWQLNGVDMPGATNQSYTVPGSGYYTVVVSNPDSCIAASSTLYVLVTGMDQPADADLFYIYPNPGRDVFTIMIKNGEKGDITIEISNALGRKIESHEAKVLTTFFEWQTDLSPYPAGDYTVTAKTGSHVYQRHLVLVK